MCVAEKLKEEDPKQHQSAVGYHNKASSVQHRYSELYLEHVVNMCYRFMVTYLELNMLSLV